ncbi:MAG: AAA family ATPase [Candidatus Anstonellales archaeon]
MPPELIISEVILRGFKSFKKADIKLLPGINVLAGPNGSGKSNICDAIRFALGEKSLKGLRAKKVSDLINHGSRLASVTINFNGKDGKKAEIKRMIRNDGKIKYVLNGKRVRLHAIREYLRGYNLDHSGRIIIAQGEVERISSLGGKARRQYIDEIAGIGEYERKKAEALKELEIVEQRIREANLILGEKINYLKELENEKARAELYKKNKELATNARGTLVLMEIEKITKDIERQKNKKLALEQQKKQIEESIAKIEEEIKKIYGERELLTRELSAKKERELAFEKIEHLKREIAVLEEKISSSNKNIIRSAENKKEINDQIEKRKERIKEMQNEIRHCKAELQKIGAVGGVDETRLLAVEKELREIEREIAKTKEEIAKKEAQLEGRKTILKEKTELLKELKRKSVAGKDELAEIESELIKIDEEIRNTFVEEKRINEQIAELDKKMLKARETLAVKRAGGPHRANPALLFIEELKKSGAVKGIHGKVLDLISFDGKIASAVEAAGGGRLLYIVVEDMDVAKKVIEKLKAANAGRATFIPLKEIKTNEIKEKDAIINMISFDEKYRKAMEYVFGETVLVKNFDEAKKLVGKKRAVTLDGELFEISGVVSGGRERGIVAAKAIEELEKELNEIREERERSLKMLVELREELSRIRARKSALEERRRMLSESEEHVDERRVKEVESEIADLQRIIHEEEDEIPKLYEKMYGLETSFASKERELESEKQMIKKQLESVEQEKVNLASKKSSLEARVSADEEEIGRINSEILELEEKLKRIEEEMEREKESIKSMESELEKKREELKKSEEDFRRHGKKIDDIMKKFNEMEERIQNLGAENNKARNEISKIEKEMSKIEVFMASLGTRLEDLNAEKARISEFSKIEGTRDELASMVEQAENELRILAESGEINLAAPQQYEKLNAEVGEVAAKIEKLKQEKEGIISVINEIDLRKKEAFFESYNKVNENFKMLFSKLDIGKGHLYLDKPEDPFNSGLYIKVVVNDRELSLNALSGGEKALVSLMFIFAMQFVKPTPFYILDEVDAPLDRVNSQRLVELLGSLKETQFIVVSHNDIVISNANAVVGVSRVAGESKLVELKLKGAG